MDNSAIGSAFSTTLYSASVGSVSTVLLCTPFDVMKNYIQASPNLEHKRLGNNFLAVASEIRKLRGISGFWAGTVVALCQTLPSNIMFYVQYEKLRRRGRSEGGAAAQARLVTSALFSPIDFIKTRVQATVGASNQTPMGVVRSVFYEDAFVSFWRGLGPTLARDVLFSGVYFFLYEKIKRKLLPEHDARRTSVEMGTRRQQAELAIGQATGRLVNPNRKASEGSLGPSDHESESLTRDGYGRTLALSFLNGAICGSVASVVTHPFDLVKTQLQTIQRLHSVNSYRVYRVENTVTIGKAIYTEYGLRGFTAGLTPRLLKIVPSCAVMLSMYEVVRSLLSDVRLDDIRSELSQRSARHKLATVPKPSSAVG